MASKPKPAEGVALSIPETVDRYAEHGVSVAVPEDVSNTESKSGQKATPKKDASAPSSSA
jgi:hypothetical protein